MREKSILEHVPVWAQNMGKNVIWADKDAFAAPVAWKDTVVLFASGASLSQYAGKLKGINGNATVVATPSNVEWLKSQGVDIDLVVVMDSHPYMGKWISDYYGPVIASTVVDASVSAHRASFYKLYIEGEGMWNAIQNFMFPHVAAGYPAEFGCVTNVAFALICDMSGKRVVLAGADYGYWKGYARVADKLQKADLRDTFKVHGVPTKYEMFLYKDALLRIWSKVANRVPVYSMSEGIVDEIPTVGLQDVLQGNWPEQVNEGDVIDRLNAHVGEWKEMFGAE